MYKTKDLMYVYSQFFFYLKKSEMKKEIPSRPEIKIEKFIDLLTDSCLRLYNVKVTRRQVGFKCLFGSSKNKELLIDLLNALLKGRKAIRDLTFNRNGRRALIYED
jgi:hypothetical protein